MYWAQTTNLSANNFQIVHKKGKAAGESISGSFFYDCIIVIFAAV